MRIRSFENQFACFIRLWFERERLGVSLKHTQVINPMKELLFSKKSVAIFASIQKDKFGVIQKISKNIEPAFGLMKDEVIGRNCSLFMTENLGKHHDELIWRFLKRGKLQENLINRMKPLIARKKSGTFFKGFLSFLIVFFEG